MAATFNTEIMTEIGKVIGNNCLEADIACLYGPGNNIHRTPTAAVTSSITPRTASSPA